MTAKDIGLADGVESETCKCAVEREINSEAVLASCPLFSDLRAEYLATLGRQVKPRKILKGEVATGLGADTDSLLIVRSGWFVQRVTHKEGAEFILSLLGAGDCIGLPELLLCAPVEAEVVAAANSEAVSIPWRVIRGLALSVPELHAAMQRELARELLMLRTRLTCLAFSPLEARLAAFLLDIERFARRTPALRCTQALIADGIGASRPKLNRCLKLLERRGWIALRSDAFPEILDREALLQLL